MGCEISKESEQNIQRTVTVIGLDNAGKSEIVFRYINNDPAKNYVSIPTAGVEFYEGSQGAAAFRIYDCGGMGIYREQWITYIEQSDAVIFVIDRSDKDRLGRVREEMQPVFEKCSELKIPLLILLNKTDLDNEIKVSDMASVLNIGQVHITCSIMECCAKTGSGINESREWIAKNAKSRARVTQNIVSV